MTAATRAALLALAERCEQASGPDRELDFAIARTIGLVPSNAVQMVAAHDPGLYTTTGGDATPVPRFTASLDAALPMEAKGYWEVTGPRRYLNIPTPVQNRWRAEFFPWAAGSGFTGWARTEAGARRAAALRALAAEAPA